MKKTFVGMFFLAVVLAACPVLGAVSAEYIGDAVVYLGMDFKGSWVGNVGNAGYHLLYWGGGEGQQLYPSYLAQAQKSPGIITHQWLTPGSTTVERAVQNAAKTERCASAWYTGDNPAYIRIPVLQNCNFVLGLYMLDWDQDGGRQAEVSVCDLSKGKSPPWKQNQGNYMEGRWNFVAIKASAGDTISIKLNALASNAPAAMLSFDPHKPAARFSGAALPEAGQPAGMASWPQYRGPNRDGKSTETGLLKQWTPGGPKELWNCKLGSSGYSSFSIAHGMIYTSGEKDGKLFIIGLELESGNIKFSELLAPAWIGDPPGSRSTPTVNDGRLYLLSSTGILMCRDAKTGARVWGLDLVQKYAARKGAYGFSESVLIEGDLMICAPGGKEACVAAFNKKTGELVWGTKGFDYEAQYASSIAIDAPGGRQIVTVFHGTVMGVSAKDGRHLWHWDRPAQAPANVTTVLFHDGFIFVANGYGCGGALGKIGQGGITQLWETKDMAPLVGEVVLVGDYLYGSHQDGGWVCLEFKTGKKMYRETKGRGPITYADGMLYCLDEENGTLDLVPAVPTGYSPVSSFKLPHEAEMKYWSMPVICDGRLYVRHGHVMFAYDIKQKQ
ncbi:MAG TPA: PQQ-binding-like beta-propeller repeat protein [Planctomycetota bacterium]|nr:PQQ-binding-like beta-propeller repeat protein [Planctomycetota bacterium]